MVDAAFAALQRARHGQAAAVWLAELPERAEAAAAELDLELGPFLPGGSVSACFAATRDGEPAVLKLAPPWVNPHAEAEALGRWDGNGAAKLLAYDQENGALLLERIEPGSANKVAGRAAIDPLVHLLGALHSVPTDELVHVPTLPVEVERRFTNALTITTGRPCSASELLPHEAARTDIRFCLLGLQLARALADGGETVLLHGDPLNKNLLTCWRHGLVAIDPSPALGDAAYDAAIWLVTHAPGKHAFAYVHFLAERLSLDRQRLTGWAAALASAETLSDPARAELHRQSRFTLFAVL